MLLEIVSPHTGGDPMSDRKWLNCRLMDIQEHLDQQGHGVSLPVISRLLKQNDYSLKANAKQLEGKQHSDRDQQFEHIQEQRAEHQAKGQPVISVDTKKRNLWAISRTQAKFGVKCLNWLTSTISRAMQLDVRCPTAYTTSSAITGHSMLAIQQIHQLSPSITLPIGVELNCLNDSITPLA
jgi:hypothetical protein